MSISTTIVKLNNYKQPIPLPWLNLHLNLYWVPMRTKSHEPKEIMVKEKDVLHFGDMKVLLLPGRED